MPFLQVYRETSFMPAHLAALQAYNLAVEVRIQCLPGLIQHTFLDDVRLEVDELKPWEERSFSSPRTRFSDGFNDTDFGVYSDGLDLSPVWMPPFPDVGLARRRVSFSAGNDETVVATLVQNSRAVSEIASEVSALHRDPHLIRPKVHFADANGAAFSGHFNQWALHLGKVSPAAAHLAGFKEGTCRALASPCPCPGNSAALTCPRPTPTLSQRVQRPACTAVVRLGSPVVVGNCSLVLHTASSTAARLPRWGMPSTG